VYARRSDRPGIPGPALAGNLTLRYSFRARSLVGVWRCVVLPDGPRPVAHGGGFRRTDTVERFQLLAQPRPFPGLAESGVFVMGPYFLQAYQPFLLIDALGSTGTGAALDLPLDPGAGGNDGRVPV